MTWNGPTIRPWRQIPKAIRNDTSEFNDMEWPYDQIVATDSESDSE